MSLVYFFMFQLRVDPYYELFCNQVQRSDSAGCDLRMQIVPAEGESSLDFDVNLKIAMTTLVSVLSKNIAPSLEV